MSTLSNPNLSPHTKDADHMVLAGVTDTPARFKRDEDGLIVGFPYRYTKEGRVDYLACIDRRHLFVIDSKKDAVAKAQGKPIDECDLSQVNPRWLRVRKAGWRQLLNIRGYRALTYHSVQTSDSKATVVCEIELIGNYETDGYPLIASGMASACTHSMDRQMLPYLETFAENRARARAVQEALNIEIMSEDEVDAEALRGVKADDNASTDTTPSRAASAAGYEVLKALCTNRKTAITFESLKARAVKHNAELTPEREDERIKSDPALWVDWSSVQDVDVWLLTGKIKEADEAAAKGKGKK